MIIKSSNPQVIPATPEETYSDIWLHEIHIQTPPTGPGHAAITFTAWQAGTTKTSGPTQRFVIPDLMIKLQSDTEFQEAWEKVTQVIAKYMIAENIAVESV